MASYRPPGLVDSNKSLYLLIHYTGAPHATSNDDVYGGYFIPKGSKSYKSRLSLTHV